MTEYEKFLESKIEQAPVSGFDVSVDELNSALLPHQKDAVLWALHGGRRALFESFGLGKCHGKGTKILMYDCTIKNVEDIVVGDMLMGDDGTPRKVLSLARGTDQMYRVTLKNGDSFTCNSAHILSTEVSNHYREHKAGSVVNMPITEYMALPEYAKRNCFKAYKRSLNFPPCPISFDPYVYGVWLGDGSRGHLSFTINDEDAPIVDYLDDWATRHDLQKRVESGRGCKTYRYFHGRDNSKRYPEKDFVMGSYQEEKRIYPSYLKNEKQVRLNLLAGLLDTDGYLIDNCYEIATKFPGLRDDILFLCRSLGLSVTHKFKVVNSMCYYRIFISGDTDIIPCRTRKKASARRQIKNPLRYGMDIEPLGIGEYYGFTIDGNHLYMLSDFTVTHNTVQELEFCHQCLKHEGGKALIVLPLGVRQEFTHDATEILHYEAPKYIINMEQAKEAPDGMILMTNYERVRDGDIDPKLFSCCVLDEAAVLRSFGSKTYQMFLPKFKGVKYKMVATATPAPNELKELIHYSGFLEIIDTGQALTRFFQRDSTKADNLTLYPHKVEEFWFWMSTWALFISKPSDLGYDDTGYDLPSMEVRTHILHDNYCDNVGRDGQYKFINDTTASLQEASKEKKQTIPARCQFAKELVDKDPSAHFILWHDREEERHTLKKLMPEVVDIYGSMDYDEREKRVIDFSLGRTRLFATKKSLSGTGCNFQRYCHRAIFVGIDYKFHDFIQAVHRIYRFLQTEKVIIDMIYTEAEQPIYDTLMEKWKLHDEQQERMREIVRKYGLSGQAQIESLKRGMGVKRTEVKGEYFVAINNDCILETEQMPENSVDMILTSIPFSNHYEYTPNYADFGHNENTERFFEQMDYLSPNLLRVLRPGRVFACHVKDRVLFGNATGTGMPTMEPFHAMCIQHYMKHGFQYFGMITIVTDVVRENNQTYRLGWTEQCKDGSKMGVGCPEYVLLFRKLPTDTSTAYADDPVTKTKEEYTRAQWQIDAHAFWRDSGDRLLTKEELLNCPVDRLQAAYRKYSRDTVYSYDEHIEMCKKLDTDGHLPATFMVMAPGSWNDDVWDDIVRVRTLNSEQKRRDLQMHVCLAEGSLILTRDGFKPIEDVKIGDFVLTHKGNWKPVIATACTGEKETIQTIATGVPNLITTPDHRLWARTTGTYPSRPKDGMKKDTPDWREAKDMENCYVNLKLPREAPENDAFHLGDDEWWLIGRYLADGHRGTRGDFFISVGNTKRKEFEDRAAAYIGTRADRGSCTQYRLKNLCDVLKMELDKCGNRADGKQVPLSGICLTKELSESLLSGYLSGDGHTSGNLVQATSVSRALLLGMAMVAQRARGVIASIYAGKPERTTMIDGREVNCRQEWVMSWRENGGHREGEILPDGAWKKAREPRCVGKRKVYSIQVADDASYTAEGCIVKNCPLQFDTVDRLINRYSNPGDIIFDPFGGIGTVPLRALKLGRRGIMTELNTEYFRDAVGYLKAEEEEQQTPTLFDML